MNTQFNNVNFISFYFSYFYIENILLFMRDEKGVK